MSHHDEAQADKKSHGTGNDAADQPEKDDDVEGHSLLTMSDAFVRSRTPNKGELEREARRHAELKESRSNRQRG